MIFNMAGGGGGGDTSGWTDITDYFFCADGETPVSSEVDSFMALYNGNFVCISMTEVYFESIGPIVISDEYYPLFDDPVGVVMKCYSNVVTPMLFESGTMSPVDTDEPVTGTIIYPTGDIQ